MTAHYTCALCIKIYIDINVNSAQKRIGAQSKALHAGTVHLVY